MSRLERLQEQFDTLKEQFDLLHEQFKINHFLQCMERFHAFDAIKDDSCPCCGGRVKVVHEAMSGEGRANAIRLEAA